MTPMMPGLAVVAFLLMSAAFAEAQGRNPIVPSGWTEEDRESHNEPLRYRSPDGTAWLTLYATPARKRLARSIIAPGEGERLTYQRKTNRFVVASGFKGDRIFYRKSNLACRGTRWHHIAMEYPAEDKRQMDDVVARIAHGMNRYDRDCSGSPSATSGGLVRGR